MELSPRLRAVADWVPPGARLVDVGTDHGLLPVFLLQKGILKRVIASDLRRGPLEKARQNAMRYGMEAEIEFRLCRGLEAVAADEVDAISICGMGGETIANILSDAAWTGQGSHTMLLQPMSSLPELRLWLSTHGYRIKNEQIICEGKELYIIFRVTAGEMQPLTPGEVWAGRQDSGMNWELRGRLLDILYRRAVRARDGLRRSNKEEDIAKLSEFQCLAEELERMKKEWDTWQP